VEEFLKERMTRWVVMKANTTDDAPLVLSCNPEHVVEESNFYGYKKKNFKE
jgi:hypothetical protein